MIECILNEPYPSVEVTCPNRTYARYMLDNLGGRISEMTAVAVYFHHSLKISDREIQEIYEQINMVEMHHMEIFGKLAEQLGENPLLWTNCGRNKVWWSPSYGDYPSNLSSILESSIEGEVAAIEKYSWQIENINDENVCANLCRIIKDEELHVKIFRDLYDRLC